MDTALSAFDGHEFSISESYQRLIDGHADVFYPMFYGFISRDMITYLFMPPRMLMFLFLKFGVITMMAIRIERGTIDMMSQGKAWLFRVLVILAALSVDRSYHPEDAAFLLNLLFLISMLVVEPLWFKPWTLRDGTAHAFALDYCLLHALSVCVSIWVVFVTTGHMAEFISQPTSQLFLVTVTQLIIRNLPPCAPPLLQERHTPTAINKFPSFSPFNPQECRGPAALLKEAARCSGLEFE